MNTPRPQPPIPPELKDALEAEHDGTDLAAVWAALEHARPGSAVSDEERSTDWQRVQADIAAESQAHRPARRDRRPLPSRSARSRPARWLAPAAATFAVAVIALFVWMQPASIVAAPGETVTAGLPDGSTVELNAGSRLTHRRGFQIFPFGEAPERRVRLEGEGYFEVVSADRPFIVETHNAEVHVLGTSFNVRARPAQATVVALEKGRVSIVGTTGPDSSLQLEPGEVASVSPEGVLSAPAVASIEQTLVWRQGGFSIQSQPLHAILEEVERRYGVQIDLRNTAAAHDSLTLYFPRPVGLETLLRDVSTARDLRYRRTIHGYEVY